MKKIILFAFTLSVFAFGQSVAQSVAEQNLDSAIQSAENVQQEVTVARKAVNQLVKQLTVLGTPNAALFESKMNYHVNSVLNNSDDVQYFVGLAQSNSSIPFSSTSIVNDCNELVNQNDIIMALTTQMTAAINANNTSLALSLVQPIRSALTKQFNRSGKIITDIEAIKTAIRTYNVCLYLTDSQGNTAIDGGFGAQNTTTGELFYPGDPNGQDYGYGNCFVNLPSGTYEFFSFPSQGSLCGTGSATVTLTPSLVNSNGVVEITMVTWCE
ncbi:hypothetical protein [Flavobacterium sp.]|uniref:hypothetical protein n=1 Tax=Flavobacterium sp. TaxID=239 RepID=UPI002B4B2FE0|nr:hypothetical protein [Flavobacterium sp.]HLP64884.1 hypothetical protein [Flavobacterium sp.]